MKRFLRISKWAVFLLGSIIALLPLALGVMTWQAEKKLGRELKALAATGAPIKSTQLAKPPIPDSENAALVYEAAYNAINLSRDDEDLLSKLGRGEVSFKDPTVAEQVRAIIARNAEALSLIRQAAAMPKIDFKEDWGKGAAALFPQYAHLRSCSRLLAYDSRLARAEGRWNDALEDCRVNFQLSRAADEPILIGQLVRYAIIAIAFRELATTLQDSIPSPQLCRETAQEISRINLTPGYVKAMEGERAMGLWAFDLIRKSDNPAKAIVSLTGTGDEDESSPASQLRQNLLLRWWWAEDESFYLQIMAEQVRRAALPYREASRLPALMREGEIFGPLGQPHIMTSVLMPVYERASEKTAQIQAYLNLARVALLLKAFRSDWGAYPDSLAELAKAEKVTLPLDPFSGKSLVYHREGEGFVLYSLSMNLKDDGGAPPKKKYRYGTGDLVLRCAR